MARLGADVSSSGWADTSADSWLTYNRLLSPAVTGMVLDNLQVRLPPGASARVALYAGGLSDTNPAGAGLIFDSGLLENNSGSHAVLTAPAAQQPIPAGARLWLANKGEGSDVCFVWPGPGEPQGDLLDTSSTWAPNHSLDASPTTAWPVVATGSDDNFGSVQAVALNYSVEGGRAQITGSGSLVPPTASVSGTGTVENPASAAIAGSGNLVSIMAELSGDGVRGTAQ